jgi:hypothetical protein
MRQRSGGVFRAPLDVLGGVEGTHAPVENENGMTRRDNLAVLATMMLKR